MVDGEPEDTQEVPQEVNSRHVKKRLHAAVEAFYGSLCYHVRHNDCPDESSIIKYGTDAVYGILQRFTSFGSCTQ
jgi:hypothetical protein